MTCMAGKVDPMHRLPVTRMQAVPSATEMRQHEASPRRESQLQVQSITRVHSVR